MPPSEADRNVKGRYLAAALGVLGAVLGIVVDLFSDRVRDLILSDWLRSAVRMVLLLVIFVGACLGTWLLAERHARQSRSRQTVEELTLDISSEDLDDDLPNDHAVVGRRLHYLERRTDSPFLAVFLPGLGLDASDFRRHMRTADEHTVALTLFGFNVEEAHSDRYRPIGLEAHAALVRVVLDNLHGRYPSKRLILVGFSVGADLILKISEMWQAHPDKALPVKGVLLLDPNIDQTTMNISTAVAAMDTSDPLAELRRLVHQATNLTEFRNICEYLRKITEKNPDQVQRHAQDILAYCSDDDSPDQFLRRLEVLDSQTDMLRVVFSFDYEQQFNGMVAAARSKRLRREIFHVAELNHFQLIDDELLPSEMKRLTSPARRPREADRPSFPQRAGH